MNPWLWVGAASLAILAAASLLLALLEGRRYTDRGQVAHLYWAIGLFLVFVTLLLEVVFYVGAWSTALMQAYLLLVAVLVGVLSLGSAEVALSQARRRAYRGFVLLAIAFTALAVLLYPAGPKILDQGVVTGAPPLLVTIASSVVTVPAAILMAASSLWAAYHLRKWQAAWTAAGIIVISVAGTLYIVSIPVTLYFAEFAGVILLFLGFGGIPSPHARSSSIRPVPRAT